jgi:uncharacterized protein
MFLPHRHISKRSPRAFGLARPLLFALGLAGTTLSATAQQAFPKQIDQLGISRGNPDAELVVREFADYQCPACRAFYPAMKKLIDNYVETGKVRLVFFDFPLDMHQNAVPAAQAARCAGRQDAYWPMHDALFENQDAWAKADDPVSFFADYANELGIDGGALAECVRSEETLDEVEQSRNMAVRLGVRSTPSTLVGQTGLRGVASWQKLKQVVEDELSGKPASTQEEPEASQLDPDRELQTVSQNRMSEATSPYLQLHADNPVNWYPWGPEAFEKAERENKPIFLSVGYFTCYWCHVMERESFSDPEVADMLNRFFVAIKVDREQRPGVDSLYMRAVNVLGQRGGWPLSMFLTPDRKPFFGGTYYPKPQFLDALNQIRNVWANQPERITSTADRVVDALAQSERMVGASGSGEIPSKSAMEAAQTRFARAFNPELGGFFDAPKFPQPSILLFLLDRHVNTGSEQALNMVRTTLDAMAAGGIHDHLGGGFHRYSTDARWHIPHFEKMLYDNAQLLRVYARAWQITGDELYRDTVYDIVRYFRSTLTDPETGLLYSAQSSLVHELEGESYIWTREQIDAALDNPLQSRVAALLYGVEGKADLEGAHVLHLARDYQAVAKQIDELSADDVAAMRKDIDAKLLEARNQREQAPVGTKHVLSWNAMMMGALANAGRMMDDPALIEQSRTIAGALLQHLYDVDGGPWRAIRGDQDGEVKAQSQDYAALARGLLELGRATGDDQWTEQAARVAGDMIERLWNPERGLFNRRADAGELLLETTDLRDGAVPAGNSIAALALTELAQSGYPQFAPYAASILRAHADIMAKQPISLPLMMTALSEYQQADLPTKVAVPDGEIELKRMARSESTTESQNDLGLKLDGVGGGVAASGGDSVFSAGKVDMRAWRNQGEVTVELAIDPGWHLNANPASLEFLIPTTLAFYAGDRKLALTPTYPTAEQIPAEGLGEGSLAVYSGTVQITSELPQGSSPDATMEAVARVQACNDEGRCLAPDDVVAKVAANGK